MLRSAATFVAALALTAAPLFPAVALAAPEHAPQIREHVVKNRGCVVRHGSIVDDDDYRLASWACHTHGVLVYEVTDPQGRQR